QIPQDERDKTLDEQLQKELPGILAWAVRGCLEWQKLGALQEPEAVSKATASYRTEMDSIARFVDECCMTGAPSVVKIKASMLANAYQAWCKRTGELPLDNRAFITELEQGGYEVISQNEYPDSICSGRVNQYVPFGQKRIAF